MATAYWPSRLDCVVIYDSALKRVREKDIWNVLSLHPHLLEDIGFGEQDDLDLFYKSRSTRAEGYTYQGRLVELVLRADARRDQERCIVFHARYL